MPIVKLLHNHIVGEPGQQVEAWGFRFTVRRTNGLTEAVMTMPEVDALREAGAGRVVIIEDDRPEKPDALSDTPHDYFGCGSSAAMREQLKLMSKAALIAFAKKHLSLEFPPVTGKDALVAQICLKAESLAEKGE